jgi:hypothetical protein
MIGKKKKFTEELWFVISLEMTCPPWSGDRGHQGPGDKQSSQGFGLKNVKETAVHGVEEETFKARKKPVVLF